MTEEELHALAKFMEEDNLEKPPDFEPAPQPDSGWMPDLNPTQERIFNDPAESVLGYGEKGSGKTIGFGHKLVRHLYDEGDALTLIGSPSIFTGKEGIWHDLDTLILPAWRDGNRYPERYPDGTTHPRAGELMDNGIGLHFTETKLDPETKDRHRWISNRHGGWSKMILKSIPHANYVEARMKGPAPSHVYMDELTNCDGREFFTYPSAQLGRRRGIKGPQQFTGSCNPEGPKHWVYKVFFEECVNSETGKRDPNFSVYHVPIQENLHRLPKGYLERLQRILRDPTERRRLLDGEWIDRPAGEGIFKDYFIEEIHVRGDALKGQGLTPLPGFPILVGYDPGPVNFCVTFLQCIPTKDRVIWIVFDELNYVGKYFPYFRVVPDILRRMDYWNNFAGKEFTYEHIADEAAFNQARPDGSFDSAEIELHGKGRIHLKPCPKGKESVAARVRMVHTLFLEECLYISALCPKSIDMFRLLISEKAKEGKYDPSAGLRPVRSVYVHPFDSMSYPIFKFSVGGLKFPAQTDAVTPMVYQCGGGH